MECTDLIRLRTEAQQLRKELEDRRARARERKVYERAARPNIQRASNAIQAHVSQHNCQE
jgi:hypothetical protein